MRHRYLAAFALLACALLAANVVAQTVQFNGSRTLDTGVVTTGPVPVSPAAPMPIFQGAASTFWMASAPASGIVNTTTAVTLKAAAGAGIRSIINSCELSHDALSGVTELAIRDGAGGTVLWRAKLQTPAVDSATYVFMSPIVSTANTLLEVVTLTGVTGGVYFNCQGSTTS